jgi:hypothetical protein
MPIEFKTRVADLRNATKQLMVNRGQFRDTDIADLLVSECVATFRAVGTTTEIPVNGISPGTARLPLPVLKMIASTAGTFKSKEITLAIEDGAIKIGSFKHRNPEIRLGALPDQRIDLPVDASLLDTLGIAAILGEATIEGQGLTNRILEAWEKANRGILSAASSLSELGVSERQIRELVEQQVEESGKRLKKAFKV